MATVNELAERMAVLETTVKLGFDTMGKALEKLSEDLSDQGKTPPAPPSARSSGSFRLPMPDTLIGYAKVLGVYLPLIGAGYAILRSGASAGGADGAAAAIDAAVELGKAAPVAVPAPVRVVPVPIPLPVPIPAEPVPHPDDLMPFPEGQ